MSKFNDTIKDWYKIAGTQASGAMKPDKNYHKHFIKPRAMISIIGSTGAGKTTALLEFLHRKNDAFYEIIIFSGSTTDEPLYNLLKEHIDGIKMIDSVEDLPELLDTDPTAKNKEKLIVFDDIINLPKKDIIKIQKWFNSARKWGFSCVAMAQNYTNLSIQIRRNSMYFLVFRLNDINSINQIIKNHNNNGDDPALVKRLYFQATAKKGDFFILDLTSDDEKRYRHNFTDFLTL